jgi:hypothetical protein
VHFTFTIAAYVGREGGVSTVVKLILQELEFVCLLVSILIKRSEVVFGSCIDKYLDINLCTCIKYRLETGSVHFYKTH